ncbi:MAG TPA: peptidyl-prolyl cis-trans isomerase [Gemmatimonadaceae bacterium]|nr:peptidyl-prolyl cis-trans isomerase [Gemmatimonadaceae bacterium]
MRSSAKYLWIFLAVFFVGGFLLAETSGLLGRAPVTTSTVVGKVNGEEILATTWFNLTQQLEQQATQQNGRTVSLDDRQHLQDQAFEQLVSEALMRQEYKRRGITVTDDEIAAAAQTSPPPQLLQSPELQTDGRFDPAKYQRFLASPAARQEGMLLQLEAYYRDAIPREKLFMQIAGNVYASDAMLWQTWKDTRDTAQMTYIAVRPDLLPDSAVQVSDKEISDYYDKNKKDFEKPARASVSVIVIPRSVSAADSAAARNRLLAIRERIIKGEKFEDVAKAESADSASGAQGGDLGKGTRGRFVPQFENAAYALKVGELSEPVLTPFGYHLIRVDSKSGDTISLRHILVRIQQSDSAATATDRRADELARIAASTDKPEKLDEASKTLGIPIQKANVVETDALTINGRFIPSVGSWAFTGAKVGETSDLYDAEDGYYLGRLDALKPGGIPSLQEATPEIRVILARLKKVDKLMPRARQIAADAVATSIQQAGQKAGIPAIESTRFTRVGGAEGIGRLNEAIGAAFSLPIGVVSAPIKTHDAIFIERVNQRVVADSLAWEKQKEVQRSQVTNSLRQQRVQEFLKNLRENAKIEDKRKEVELANRAITQ